MGKRGRGRERERANVPQVNIEVAHAEGSLLGAAALVKPAILYGDKVTIFSPAAAMLRSVEAFAEITEPFDRLQAILDIVQQAPSLAPDLSITPEVLEQL